MAAHLTPTNIDPQGEVDVDAAVYAAHRLSLDPDAPVVALAGEREDALVRELPMALSVIDKLPRWRTLARKAAAVR